MSTRSLGFISLLLNLDDCSFNLFYSTFFTLSGSTWGFFFFSSLSALALHGTRQRDLRGHSRPGLLDTSINALATVRVSVDDIILDARGYVDFHTCTPFPYLFNTFPSFLASRVSPTPININQRTLSVRTPQGSSAWLWTEIIRVQGTRSAIQFFLAFIPSRDHPSDSTTGRQTTHLFFFI